MDNHNFKPADLELGQCHIRLWVPIPLLILWYGYWFSRTANAAAYAGLVIMGVFSLYAVLNWLHVKRYPGENWLRRTISITADQASCFIGMLMTGALGGAVLFLPLWISLGNGIRFGVKWMAWSVALASAGVVALGVASGYWAQHLPWLFGLLLLNVAIPFYMTSLIRGFHANRSRLTAYADEMKNLALKDALTGLPNRTAFFEALDRASAHANRINTSLAILYFDLNGFKQVNDNFGHTTGDRLLREVAERVGAELRSEDVLARLGGDEFVLLLQLDQASQRPQQVASRVLQVLATIRSIEGNPLEVTASVGIVVVKGRDAAGLGAETLVELADRNMYAAKRADSKNMVLTYYVAEHRQLALV
ncbi:MAG: GGDEF domain-containing protein [Thiobacillus sp.]|nr:GGDEF domain-containing protein [Thiobacillus sp.]